MVDSLTRKKRSWNMSRIRNKDTKPEVIVRSLLHRIGYRFKLHKKELPGKPDIILPKYKTVIFVHGCFWHRHQGCKNCTTPKSNIKFWKKKFDDNVKRDKKNCQKLTALGWNIIIIWECELKNTESIEKSIWQVHQKLQKVISS